MEQKNKKILGKYLLATADTVVAKLLLFYLHIFAKLSSLNLDDGAEIKESGMRN
jgi:hypothetical protein